MTNLLLLRVRRGIGGLYLACALAGTLLVACDSHKKTHPQVLLEVDADAKVRSTVRWYRLEVFGDYSPYPSEKQYEETFEEGQHAWPRTFALAPRDGDHDRRYRFEITGYGGDDGNTEILRRRGYGSYPWEAVETFRLTLTGDCLDIVCPARERTCEQGRCVDADIDFYGKHRPCTGDAHCDDSFGCTEDVCGEDGYCRHVYVDDRCPEGYSCLNWGCDVDVLAFVCGNTAVRAEQVCDGNVDCPDGSDEAGCRPGYYCFDVSSRIIPFEFVCDGKSDCDEGQDEYACPVVPAEKFTCPTNEEISFKSICDGVTDCGDGWDEEPWRCEPRFFCRSGNHAVLRHLVCDGVIDCDDGSDEASCQVVHGGF